MRIYHIKDSYMFNKNNKNGTHRYCVYYDRKTKQYRAIEMTHIYELKKSKEKLIKDGLLKPFKLRCYGMPQGIETSYFTKNVDGKPIRLDKSNSRKSYSLTKWESRRIKNIANKEIKRK